jgi:predicted nuclease with TOPRIM domain
VESHVEKKVLGLLDVIALEVTELRGDVTELRGDVAELRGDVTELRGEVGTIREDLAAFRVETSQNFNRITRRLDNHKTRIVALEQREV